MVTGRIQFLTRCVVMAGADGLGHHSVSAIYEAGETYDMPEPSCQRWIRRGKAVWAEVPSSAGDDEIEAETDFGASGTDARPGDIQTDEMVDSARLDRENRGYRRRRP